VIVAGDALLPAISNCMDIKNKEQQQVEAMQQLLKDNLKARIQNMTIIRVNFNELDCGEDAPMAITIEGRPK